MEEENQPREPKIDLVTALLLGLAILVLDIVDVITAGVGSYITTLIAAMVFFYLNAKGVSGMVFLIGEGLELIPVIQILPLKTLAWGITVGVDHFAPAEVAEKLEKAGELAQAGEGSAAGGGTAAKGAAAEKGAQATAGAAKAEGGAMAREEVGVTARDAYGEEGATKAGGTGGEGEENEEALEKKRKEAELEREMETGAEVSPEEEMRQELFEPEEAQFREATGFADEEESDEDEEDQSLKKAA